jgi:HD-GYP domain-containing protein (c-di-GMP phosphodiesterase class II)
MSKNMLASFDATHNLPEPDQLLIIFDHANQIAATTDLDELLNHTLGLMADVAEAESGWLCLYNQAATGLVIKAVNGLAGLQNLMGRQIDMVDLGSGVIEDALREQQVIMVEFEAYHPARLYKWEELSDWQVQNSMAVPLLLNNNPVGVVQLFNANPLSLKMVQLLGNRMATEIQKLTALEASTRREKRFQALVDILGHIGSTLNRDQILSMILDYTCQMLDTAASSLFLVDQETGELVLQVASSNQQGRFNAIRIPAGQGIAGQVVETGQSVKVTDVLRDKRHYNRVDQSSGFITRSILAVPLRTQPITLSEEHGLVNEEQIIGCLEALNKFEGDFTDEDMVLLETLARQAANVLQISGLYTDLNDLFFDIINTLSAAIDAKDPYTQGHSQRVSEFSVVIAQELNLGPEIIRHIRIGGILHDVGKIGVPDAVLKKTGRLTADEYEEIKKHPAIGEKILSEVKLLQTELPALAEHHERLDGKGYPRGLQGENISLMGRIVATADAFDAMTSNRSYRNALSPEEAIRRLREGTGTQFDPHCVDALIRGYDQGRIVISPDAP